MRRFALGWVLGLCVAACSAAPQLQPPTPSATLTTAPAATPINTPPLKPRVTPQPIEAAVDALKAALHQSDPQMLLSLLGNSILLEGTSSQMLNREAALHWLAARWQASIAREVTATDYIEHFVLLEVKTTGWVRLDGATSDAITFNLHRYNEDGKADALSGSWRIDAIFFQ